MKAKVIAVVGPVGIGKSTVINALTHLSRKSGLKVKSAYINVFHSSSYLLWKVARRVLIAKENSRLAPWYIIGKVNSKVGRVLLLISMYLDTITIPLY